MANQEQLEILKQGDYAWDTWRMENPDIEIDLAGANLKHARLGKFMQGGPNLREANLQGANLTESHLRNVNFYRANLSNANFSEANIGNCNLLEANLTNANFSDSTIRASGFSRANLIEAKLVRANIFATQLDNANMKGVVLFGATIEASNLGGSDLSGADLNLGRLLIGTILDGTIFSKAEMGNMILSNIDLSEAIDIETIRHTESSSIGMEVIHRFNGKAPTGFLRGCGLRDIDIEYAKLANRNLTPEQVTDITYKIHQLYLGGGVLYYSCFISYSSKDQEFAQILHDDLQNNGVRCWFDREDLKIGDSIRPTIDRQIRLRDKLLVILSENSIKSEWVGDEVEGALEEEQKGSRSILFPIRLDDTALNTRDDWAAKIKRRRHIGDFSNWKDKASYQKAFERLLRDLKATGS